MDCPVHLHYPILLDLHWIPDVVVPVIWWIKSILAAVFVGVILIGMLYDSVAWVLAGGTGEMYLGAFC